VRGRVDRLVSVSGAAGEGLIFRDIYAGTGTISTSAASAVLVVRDLAVYPLTPPPGAMAEKMSGECGISPYRAVEYQCFDR